MMTIIKKSLRDVEDPVRPVGRVLEAAALVGLLALGSTAES